MAKVICSKCEGCGKVFEGEEVLPHDRVLTGDIDVTLYDQDIHVEDISYTYHVENEDQCVEIEKQKTTFLYEYFWKVVEEKIEPIIEGEIQDYEKSCWILEYDDECGSCFLCESAFMEAGIEQGESTVELETACMWEMQRRAREYWLERDGLREAQLLIDQVGNILCCCYTLLEGQKYADLWGRTKGMRPELIEALGKQYEVLRPGMEFSENLIKFKRGYDERLHTLWSWFDEEKMQELFDFLEIKRGVCIHSDYDRQK